MRWSVRTIQGYSRGKAIFCSEWGKFLVGFEPKFCLHADVEGMLPNTITLTEDFFNDIQHHALPVDMAGVQPR